MSQLVTTSLTRSVFGGVLPSGGRQESDMTSFAIPEMSCGLRSRAIESALTTLDPDATIDTNVQTRLLRVETKESDAQVLMTLNILGFAANVYR